VNRKVVRWRDWSGEGLEHLVLDERPDGVHADSVVVGEEAGEVFAAWYRIACDAGWRVRHCRIGRVGQDSAIELASDGAGAWLDGGGRPRHELAGAFDIDITVTPFTNTLPIRRLSLREGEASTIAVVYVEVPELSVTTRRQRYTCLEPGRLYRFESLDSDFTRELEVDADGLVVTYPDLFRRIA
jgi:hypothetical protein